MRQPLGILRAIHGANAEGKKSSENSSNDRIWPRRRPWLHLHSQTLIHELLIAGLWRRLRRHESRCRGSAFQTGCEAGLAVNYSADVAGAVAAERLASGAAEGHCGSIV